jgi:hypothetical protein
MRKCKCSVCGGVLGLIVAWATSGCVDQPSCNECTAQDESTLGETSTGDGNAGDGDGDGDGGKIEGDGNTPQILQLSYAQIKQFDFTWTAAVGAETYKLLEQADFGEDYVQVGTETASTQMSLTVPLHLRLNARYIVQACDDLGCTDHAAVDTVGSMAEAIGYVKASNSNADDMFGWSVAISKDGDTVAVGARGESSSATGIEGDQSDNSAIEAGAVYVFVRDEQSAWSQQAYIKASNADPRDEFGTSVALSADGDTLVVGAPGEMSIATGIDGNQSDNSINRAGAAYVFVRDEQNAWSQQAYVKASNTPQYNEFDGGDVFGDCVALSDDGDTLAVGARLEWSSATGIGGDQADDSAYWAGAVYLFERDVLNAWSQQAYIKASNTDADDQFGGSLALSGDGNTLVVGAISEDSAAMGIGGNQADNSVDNSGAVYVFARDGQSPWSQQAYVKASHGDNKDYFGFSVALSDDGNTLVVGATGEDSAAMGIEGNQADNSVDDSGAVYVFGRDGQDAWAQQTYVKAPYTHPNMKFGTKVALSGDGNTLIVGALMEGGGGPGIGSDPSVPLAFGSGAVHVFARNGQNAWSQQAYVKASNPGAVDTFGGAVALSKDATTMVVGARFEQSAATGISGDQLDESAYWAGAVYLY